MFLFLKFKAIRDYFYYYCQRSVSLCFFFSFHLPFFSNLYSRSVISQLQPLLRVRTRKKNVCLIVSWLYTKAVHNRRMYMFCSCGLLWQSQSVVWPVKRERKREREREGEREEKEIRVVNKCVTKLFHSITWNRRKWKWEKLCHQLAK